MTAYHNKVDILIFGHAMHFLGRVAENNMLVATVDIELLCQGGQSLGCLSLKLTLYVR
jgi:hypothetical protein